MPKSPKKTVARKATKKTPAPAIDWRLVNEIAKDGFGDKETLDLARKAIKAYLAAAAESLQCA